MSLENRRRETAPKTWTDPWESGRADEGGARARALRVASMALGGGLVLAGVRRRSLRGAAMAAVGAGLLFREFDGASRVKRAVETRTSISDGEASGEPHSTEASRSITVDGSPEELYETFRDPEQLSTIVGHFADVTSLDDDRRYWTVDGPGGRTLSWETRFVEDEPGEVLRWETPGDATLRNEGSVRFRQAPGDRGTIVTLAVSFEPPGGAVGNAAVERLGVVPETLVERALDRFKSLAETGEVPTLEGNSSGRGEGDLV